MRDYGKVHTSFWSSDTMRALTNDGRLLAIYLMTSPHSTIAGVFRLPDGYVCEDMQWTPERVAQGFSELLAKGFANRCETTKWVWVMKHLEWNPPENPNQRKSAAKVALAVPVECPWKLDFMRVCGPLLGIETVIPANPSATLQQPFLNQEPEQEQEQEHSAKAGGKPPKLTDPKEIIFGFGLALLVNAGNGEKQARSFLGGRVKEYDEASVVDALRDCAKAKPLEPLTWLAAALPPKASAGKPNAQQALEASNREVVRRALEKDQAHETH